VGYLGLFRDFEPLFLGRPEADADFSFGLCPFVHDSFPKE
jgi:hypothetical protein